MWYALHGDHVTYTVCPLGKLASTPYGSKAMLGSLDLVGSKLIEFIATEVLSTNIVIVHMLTYADIC